MCTAAIVFCTTNTQFCIKPQISAFYIQLSNLCVALYSDLYFVVMIYNFTDKSFPTMKVIAEHMIVMVNYSSII